jgi:hypothetical protein
MMQFGVIIQRVKRLNKKGELIMLKTIGHQTINIKAFDDYRNVILEDFFLSKAFLKKRFSQGAYWTALDKDLATQYFRDEVWFLGRKVKDVLKFIDHGFDSDNTKDKLGFNKK